MEIGQDTLGGVATYLGRQFVVVYIFFLWRDFYHSCVGGVFWLADSLFWSSFVSAPSVFICGMSCIVHFWMHTSHLGVVVVRYVGGHISYACLFFHTGMLCLVVALW